MYLNYVLFPQLVEKLLSQGFHCLKSATNSDTETREVESCQAMTSEQSNLELAKYCDKYLRLIDDGKFITLTINRCG